MIYEFEVPGEITGKARPRLNSYTGQVYTPTKTKDYELLVKQYFKLKYPKSEVFEGRLFVKIIAFFKVPKNITKKEKNEIAEGRKSPTKKPDIDNIVKIILDSLNRVCFKDDNQITKIEVEKIYSEEEKIYVRIEEY